MREEGRALDNSQIEELGKKKAATRMKSLQVLPVHLPETASQNKWTLSATQNFLGKMTTYSNDVVIVHLVRSSCTLLWMRSIISNTVHDSKAGCLENKWVLLKTAQMSRSSCLVMILMFQ